MTREIKFRIMYKKYNNTWLKNEYTLRNLIELDGADFLGDDDIIEQYTGLKDRNGKEIYEGDIVSISDAPAVSGKALVVKFDEFLIEEYNCNRMTGWMVQVVNGEWCSSLADVISRCEVIGTIHENSDLLGGKE